MDKSIQNKKIELIQWLSTLEDELVIDKIMRLRQSEMIDWWKEISKEERDSLEKGIKDAKAGKVKPHSSARDLYEKWL